VPAAGFPLELIHVGALNQVSLATRVKTLLGLPLAVLSSLRIVRKFSSGCDDWSWRLRFRSGYACCRSQGRAHCGL